MTPERVRALVAQLMETGRSRSEVARLLGFTSENSLRQCETGRATLRPDRAAWLEGYARLCARLARTEADWLENNPKPRHK
jgi:hypothetical protein